MEFALVVENRHSTKEFSKREVPEEKIKRILYSAKLSPSWTNEQCWKFVIVDDPKIKKQIVEAIPKGNTARRAVEAAPVVAVMCADPALSGEVDRKEYYMVDAGIAMEHLVLAAVNEGLGTCWVGAFDEEKVRDIIDIPRRYRVVAMTPIGFPEGGVDNKYRRDLDEIAFRNTWDTPVNYLQ